MSQDGGLTRGELWHKGNEQQKASAGLALGAIATFGLGKFLPNAEMLEYAAILPAVLALLIFFSGGSKKAESMD